jgi:D-alanine-D-alanine ligase
LKNIGIFCGGFSSEFEISLKSAKEILAALSKENYNSFLVIVTREGWEAQYKGEQLKVSVDDFSFESSIDGRIVIDAAHVYIHGNPGENGKLQAYFEMKLLPFINSSALSSELSFDKWFCNQFLRGFGIQVADAIILLDKNDLDLKGIGERLGYPLFVKPSDSGSSYGISKVYKEEDLLNAIEGAFNEGSTVICEAFMDGKEVTCGVYRNIDGAHALPCTEIVTTSDFFDYEAKYLGKSEEITPARISDELTKRIQDLTVRIYKLLQLRALARIDFIIINEEPHVIEVNTTPGFSAESIVPKMLKASNISVSQFWAEVYDFELKASN